MAMIDCPECKAQVSDTAPACPHCGHVSFGRRANKTIGRVLTMLFILFALLMGATLLLVR
jgi:hypothetical protein